jgi:hypothetical protein
LNLPAGAFRKLPWHAAAAHAGTLPDLCRARGGADLAAHPSKFDGEAFPDFVYPLFQRVKSGVDGFIVKVKDIAAREGPENPVVALDVDQHLLNRVPHGHNRAQQNIHRIPRLRKNGISAQEDFIPDIQRTKVSPASDYL